MAITRINDISIGGGGGSATPTMVHWNGGRIQQTTSNDTDTVALGGSIGATYYNWSQVVDNQASLVGLGTPGTTTKTMNQAYYFDVCGFFIPAGAAGDISVMGVLRDDSATTVANSLNYIQIWKVSSTFITAMQNGTQQITDTCTLVASAEVQTPSTGASIRPVSFLSTNGVGVAAGDYCFAGWSTNATVLSTEYRVLNYKVFTN